MLYGEKGLQNGFMYWHYWLGNGRMLLEKPFQEVLDSIKPDFRFVWGGQIAAGL